MKEIKFRAWDKYAERFEYIESAKDLINWIAVPHESTWGTLSELGWEQYVGSNDMNGVDMYHKDIVLIPLNGTDNPWCKRVIEWEMGMWCIEVTNGDYIPLNKSAGGFVANGNIQVIGNIHDHPHLIEEQ